MEVGPAGYLKIFTFIECIAVACGGTAFMHGLPHS